MELCGLVFASFQEVDWLRLWLGPALRRGWLRGGLSCMDARRDWFLLGGLVPGMTGGKGVMAGGQTDWFVLRPSLFIERLPGAGVDTRGPVGWLADRRAALLSCVFCGWCAGQMRADGAMIPLPPCGRPPAAITAGA